LRELWEEEDAVSFGYMLLSLVVVGLFGVAWQASYQGWGLTNDASALAQARQRTQSVRTGSVHRRSYYGGGPGFGK
jgi:capsule polysaccharide export protein KpsC/LpsZ